jgi:outer membrane protein assembly factor BamB
MLKKFVILSYSLILLLSGPELVTALDTDIYVLTYSQIQIHPDALLLLDLSGSMNWTPAGGSLFVDDSSHCTNHTYDSGYNGPYYSQSDTGHTYQCNNIPYSGSRPIYGDSTCSDATGFYKTSGGAHTTDCSRVAIAKRAIKNVLDDDNNGTVNTDDETSLGLRFGFMRFTDCSSSSGDGTSYTSGCNRRINDLNTSYSTIWSSVNGQTAEGGTHLAAALNEARIYLNYHKSQDDAKDCRQKFVIVVTDGADTLACSGNGTEDQQDQYKRRRETVAKVKALADAGYKVFVVGFGAVMPHWLRNTLNWAAYYGGTKSSTTPSSPGSPPTFNPASYISNQSTYTTCGTSSSTNHHNIEGDGDHYYATPISGDPGELSLTGYAFLATSAEELGTAIKAIAKYIADLMKESVSYVAPVVPISQMEKTSAGNRMYLGMFKPAERSLWKGNIKKFGIANRHYSVNEEMDAEDPPLTAKEVLNAGDIYDSGGRLAMDTTLNIIKTTSDSFWTPYADDGVEVEKGGTGSLLLNRDFSTNPRKIYTYLGTNVNLTDASNAFSLTNTGPTGITPERLGLTSGQTTERDQIINFIHGLDAYDWYFPCGDPGPQEGEEAPRGLPADGITNTKRCWGLGAYIHSRPLILHYAAAQSTIFVGGNDGMLHAFDDATGEELWAFIPPNFLPRLKNLNGPIIEFFADGSPKIYVERDGSGNITKAILIFGERRGGNRYLALDVADRLNPKFLWEINPSQRIYGTTTYATTDYKELGQTWSTPQIGKIKNGSDGKWVAFIGAGYDTNQDNIPVLNPDTKGRGIYAVDILTGEKIWRYTKDEDPSGMVYSIPSDISRVDVDGNGNIDRLYVGDMGGRIWRFNIGDAGNPAAWTGSILFNAQGKIFYPPDVTFENDSGNYEMLFFGTGDRENPRGELASINRLYAIKDKPPYPHTPMVEGDLKDVTEDLLQDPDTPDSTKTTIFNELRSKHGWFIKLDQRPGEKCLSNPVVFYGAVYYTTFAPTVEGQSNICYLGPGSGIFYAVDYKTGNAVFNFDATNDTTEEVIKRSDRGKVIGPAIPSGVIITVIGGSSAGYVGIGGGVYVPDVLKRNVLIPVNWKMVF